MRTNIRTFWTTKDAEEAYRELAPNSRNRLMVVSGEPVKEQEAKRWACGLRLEKRMPAIAIPLLAEDKMRTVNVTVTHGPYDSISEAAHKAVEVRPGETIVQTLPIQQEHIMGTPEVSEPEQSYQIHYRGREIDRKYASLSEAREAARELAQHKRSIITIVPTPVLTITPVVDKINTECEVTILEPPPSSERAGWLFVGLDDDDTTVQ